MNGCHFGTTDPPLGTTPRVGTSPYWSTVTRPLSLTVDSPQFNIDPVNNDERPPVNPCAKKPKPGKECLNPSTTSQIRWYYNEERFECLAYNFYGCSVGGIVDLDGFRTKTECDVRCKPRKYMMFSEPMAMMEGSRFHFRGWPNLFRRC